MRFRSFGRRGSSIAALSGVLCLVSTAGAQAPAPTQPAPTQPAPTQPAPSTSPAPAPTGTLAPAPSTSPAPPPATPTPGQADLDAQSDPSAAPADPFDANPPPAADPDAAGAESGDASAESEGSFDPSQPRVIDTSKDESEDVPPPPPPPEIDPNSLPFTYHMRHFDLAAGFRVVNTRDDGLEPFLEDPVLGDLYLRGGVAFDVAERFALAVAVEWSSTGSEAQARALLTEIEFHRATLGVEGRYHFHHRFYGYARVSPGLEFGNAKFDQLNLVYEDKSTAFHVDGTAGMAMRFAGSSNGKVRRTRFFGFVEGGYRLAMEHEFVLAADGGPPRAQALSLPALDTSGVFAGSGLMLTF